MFFTLLFVVYWLRAGLYSSCLQGEIGKHLHNSSKPVVSVQTHHVNDRTAVHPSLKFQYCFVNN